MTCAEIHWLETFCAGFKKMLKFTKLIIFLSSGRLKLKKHFLPLLLGGGFKFLLLPLAIVAIAVMAFKALAIGKLALLIAASVGLPKLFNGGGLGGLFAPKTKTIEVVSHPVHSFSSSGSGGYSSGQGGFAASTSNGWSRTIDAQQEDAQKLVYRGQAPAATQQ
jgi:hypothetical protein